MIIIIIEIILVILIGIYSVYTLVFLEKIQKRKLLFLNFLNQKIFHQCLLHISMEREIQRNIEIGLLSLLLKDYIFLDDKK